MRNTNPSRRLPSEMTLVVLTATLGCFAYAAALAQTSTQAQSESRETEINRLRQIIRDKEIQEQDPEQVDKAMRRLGELKAVEAIDDLTALLGFRYPKEMRTGGAYDGYRAKSVLFRIGKPALPALVRAIAENDIGSIEFKNARQAVMYIFRDDLPAGSNYLREAATKFSSSAAQARLWAAADWIDELHAKSEALREAEKNPR